MTFNIFIRRTHLYLALFLTPWILMYALAVFGGNHRALFVSEDTPHVKLEKEKEQNYQAAFTEDVDPRLVGELILADLGLEGTYIVRHNKQRGIYLILRRDPINPRRITYIPAEEKIIVERQLLNPVNFLQGLHHRNSYRQENLMDDSWAISVDLAIIGMIFWVLSGLWMWWGLKLTRRWGLVALLAGFGLFGFFLIAI
jgi:hypothetical protein